ncbi:PhnD/SsuA/transferrin family substrate-binding protein [Humisphaera borealis]|uniref:PhnD/SsuA/transferrin family substrate-binding protein n=1 Tax=Humisphaera borealis TaxID=2807512 RepID=A0A7M2X296_9BACT|nr:PhnD/SsuA/transferrin family substrate-binding protein [Humisphaera borealis]QOV91843.1 PhnD/SsuA/transferrin family substrate-binding protein [Humisphaera borealis]
MKWPTSFHLPLTRVARAKLAAAVMLLVVPALGLYGGYFLEKEGLAPTLLGRQRGDTAGSKLMGPPVRNQLDPAYADADGDLVADAPLDERLLRSPTKLIMVVPLLSPMEDFSQRWTPLVDHLSKAAGKPVSLEVAAADENGRLLSLRKGDVHLAVVGAGAVPLAVNAAGFVPVGMFPADDGSGFTRMVLVVPSSSAVMSPSELRGAEMLFVDPSSNTGFKAAAVALRDDFGLRPGRDFTWSFSGSPQASIAAIKERRAPAAAIAESALSEELAARRVDESDYRVIYRSERYPSAAIGIAHDLNPLLAEKLRRALLSFNWSRTSLEAILGANHTRFVPVNYRADWWMVRRIDDATGTSHTLGVR